MTGRVRAAMIGTGAWAKVLATAARGSRVELVRCFSPNAQRRAAFAEATGIAAVDAIERILDDATIDAVVIAAPNELHRPLADAAARHGKHVFVEKPIGLTEEEVERVAEAARESGRMLMVGFNRRFAPLTRELESKLAGRGGPLATVITVNAGAIPPDHWTQDAEQGGGRIVGEACHFIDLARALTGSPIVSLTAAMARTRDGRSVGDIATFTLGFGEGSVSAIHYIASGSRSYPKERVECFFDGRTVSIENWRRLRDWGAAVPWRVGGAQDKGHAAELRTWIKALRDGGPAPIPLDEIVEVSRWAVRAAAPYNETDGRDR